MAQVMQKTTVTTQQVSGQTTQLGGQTGQVGGQAGQVAGQTILGQHDTMDVKIGSGAGAGVGGGAAKLAALGLGGGMGIGSSIRVRSINVGVGAGGGAAKGKGSGMSQLKMQAMALGGSGTIAIKELAVSPGQVVVSREKEKLALQELNDRFAAYIERVRFLEADNKRLQGIINTLTLKFEELDATLRAIYDAELAAARKALDETTAQKAAIEIKVAGLEAKVFELTALYTAEYEAHILTKESVPKLEKMISERDAQIDFLTKNVSSMEVEIARLKGQIASLQKELSTSKQSGDAEVVARVELESLLTTKDDEIAFLTNLYEEKVKALMSIDLGSDAFASAFSNELALALRDIRGEYEAIMEATRTQDTDAWYKAKFNEVMATTQRATGDLAAAKQEVSAARAKYQSLMAELMALRAQLAAANERIASLEAEMATAAAAAALSIEERDGIINGLRASLAEYVIELKGLTDIKLALDAEIATYRRLLAGEETRFSQDVLGGKGGGLGLGLGGGAGGGGGGGGGFGLGGGGGGGQMSGGGGGGGFGLGGGGGGGGGQISGGGGGGGGQTIVGGQTILGGGQTILGGGGQTQLGGGGGGGAGGVQISGTGGSASMTTVTKTTHTVVK